ncbi:glycosyltransferase family 4 protein [Candidatus Dependentiae bacterium]
MKLTKNQKPKIAILTIKNSYGYGGVLTCVKQVYKFCEQYFDPTIFVLSFDKDISTSLKLLKFSSRIKKTEYFGMKCVQVGARWAFWEPGHYIYSLNSWKKVLQGYDYFFFKSGSCIASYPLVQLNKKFVMWVGTAYEDDKSQRVKNLPVLRYLIDRLAVIKMRKIEREIFDKANLIFSISKNTKKRIEQILGYKRDNLLICGYPISKKESCINDEKNIIAVGRFSDPRKNIKMLLRVFKNIYEKNPKIKLFVVGKKPSQTSLLEFSKKTFFKNIIFTGLLDQKDIEKYYQKSSLMLITSYQEGLGIVGLEALSYGIPVVSTDCGGTKDYVVNGENGYLVKINDVENMTQKTLKILNSAELYKKMSKFALDFIDQNFSQEKIHSLFKVGLTRVYPELYSLFEQSKTSDKINLLKRDSRGLEV